MAKLVLQRYALHFYVGGDDILFVNDEKTIDHAMSLTDWRDMGEPTVITVTIEPGDRLNADLGDKLND